MPSLNQLPGEIKQVKFVKVLSRLGFIISTKGGNGSHIKVTWPTTQKAITIPNKLPKQVLYYLLKEIKEITNGQIVWEDIKEKL